MLYGMNERSLCRIQIVNNEKHLTTDDSASNGRNDE